MPGYCESSPSGTSPGLEELRSPASNNNNRLTTLKMPSACCGDSSTTSSPAMAGQPSQCAGCGGQIGDRYFLNAADHQWHIQCLRCCDCKLQLDSELTCYSKDGKIYCKDDYFKRFSVKRCARCYLAISSNEMVMRAKGLVYHLLCFTCTVCNRPLNPGDYFGMREHQVYCRLHYEMLFVPPMDHQNPPPISGMFAGVAPTGYPNSGLANGSSPPAGTPFFNGIGPPHSHTGSGHAFNHHKGRPRKRKGTDILGDFCAGLTDLDTHHGYENDAYHSHPPPPRSKRMRTSFKHHQLRTMKSYFSVNHNPDAKDLKQLAQKTGLTKRVLQVWFQNARAKYRRTVLKKDKDGTTKDEQGNDQNSSRSPSNEDSDPLLEREDEKDREDGRDLSKEFHGSDGESVDDKHTIDELNEMGENIPNESSPENLVTMPSGVTYSELKTASPALADEVSSVSSMPTKRGNCLPLADCDDVSLRLKNTSLSPNFLPGYSDIFRS